jgi:hypothetical protein
MGMKQSLGASTIAVLSLLSSGAAAQSHQTTDVEKRPITIVGCVQRESDYRRMHDSGKGGPLGLGAGRGDEYVLVNAFEITPGQAIPAGTDMSCGDMATGEAYELEGGREKDLEAYVGQRLEISGTRGKAEINVASGRPTGGNAHLGQDLRLFEVDVASFREPQMAEMRTTTTTQTAMAETPAAPEAPQQQVEQAAPSYEPTQPVGTSGMASQQARAELPGTATALPMAGLIGLFSLVAGLGLRVSRRS